MTDLDYASFVRAKVQFDTACGFDIDATAVNPILKPHQAAIVRWAVRGGRRAIFAAFGLGKSVMQLEALRRHNQSWRNWRVICTCGWRSRNVFYDEAQIEANRHKELTK